MTDASRAHNLFSVNIAASLYCQLREKPCEVITNDMRVKGSATRMNTYPDIVAACGKP